MKIPHERLDGDILTCSHEVSKEEHADALASVIQRQVGLSAAVRRNVVEETWNMLYAAGHLKCCCTMVFSSVHGFGGQCGLLTVLSGPPFARK